MRLNYRPGYEGKGEPQRIASLEGKGKKRKTPQYLSSTDKSRSNLKKDTNKADDKLTLKPKRHEARAGNRPGSKRAAGEEAMKQRSRNSKPYQAWGGKKGQPRCKPSEKTQEVRRKREQKQPVSRHQRKGRTPS